MYVIGNTVLYLGILIALYSIIANIIGMKKKSRAWIESARGGVLSLVLLSCIAAFLLFYLLGTSQFQFKYVAAYTSENLSLVYKLTAFWAEMPVHYYFGYSYCDICRNTCFFKSKKESDDAICFKYSAAEYFILLYRTGHIE